MAASNSNPPAPNSVNPSGSGTQPNPVVIPLSQDKSQRSLFSLTKVVRLGKATTAVDFESSDLLAYKEVLEDARTGKYALLSTLRRLGCLRLGLEDVKIVGGVVRVLSLVHPKDEVRKASGRLLGRWKRMVFREVFPLPNSGVKASAAGREEGVEGDVEVGVEGGAGLEGGAGTGLELADTYGYDVETARNAPEGEEIAPEDAIRLEEEEAAAERLNERKLRVEEDPFGCSSSEDEGDGESESDMWSPGAERKRRARAAAAAQRKKGKKEGNVDGEEGKGEDKGEEKKKEKPKMGRAFMNLFAGTGGKKKEGQN